MNPKQLGGGGAAQQFLASNSLLPENGLGWGSKKVSKKTKKSEKTIRKRRFFEKIKFWSRYLEVITTREPPGTGTDFEVGQVEEHFEQFLPTSAQFPAFFSVLKMASESAKIQGKIVIFRVFLEVGCGKIVIWVS